MNNKLNERISMLKKGEITNGYKKTKLGIIPDAWEIKPLGSIIEVLTDYHANGSYEVLKQNVELLDKEGYALMVRTTNFENNDFNNDTKFISEHAYNFLKKSKVYPNDILMNKIANAGAVYLMPNLNRPVSLAMNLFLIRIKEQNPIFIYSYLKFIEPSIKMLATGTTTKTITKDDVRDIEVVIPNVYEQQKITDIISTWEKAIKLKEKLIQTKKEQKKALEKNLLTGEQRLKGCTKPFEKLKLGDLFDRVTRKNSEGNTNVLTISAQQGLINQNDFFNKTVASDILDNYYLLRKGEFAYNKSYSKGYPMGAIKRLNDYDSGVVTTLYICFKLKEEFEQWSDFFEQYFEAGLLNRGLTEIAQEGGRAHGLLNVPTSDFFDLEILIPSEQEQSKIAEILRCADKEIFLLEKELEALKKQKKGLMQLLLTGIVRV